MFLPKQIKVQWLEGGMRPQEPHETGDVGSGEIINLQAWSKTLPSGDSPDDHVAAFPPSCTHGGLELAESLRNHSCKLLLCRVSSALNEILDGGLIIYIKITL